MAPWIAGLIGVAVGIVVSCLGVAVAWGRIKQKLDEVADLKRGLYKPDGTLVYVPAEECEKRRDACNKVHTDYSAKICREIVNLSKTLRKIEIAMARLAGREEGNNHD